MMTIPIRVIAFFLATLVLPANVNWFTIVVEGKIIQWTRQDAAWRAVDLPCDDQGLYSVGGNVVTVSAEGKESKTDLTEFLALPAGADFTAATEIPVAKESFGTPIRIMRKRNTIILLQTKGVFFQVPATIAWAEPEEPKGQTTP